MNASDSISGKIVKYALLVACAAASILVMHRYFRQAYPESEIPLSIDREQAIRSANSFLGKLGYEIDNFKVIVSFERDRDVDHYLQRKLGIDKLNTLTRTNDICIHYFRVRYYRPGSEEDFIAGIAPDGEFDGFRRHISKDAVGVNLDQPDALEIATEFLTEIANEDLSLYSLTANETMGLQNRTDHKLIWSREWPHLEGIQQDIRVHIQGDRVSFYENYINIPDAFIQDFKKQTSYGSLLVVFSNLASIILFVSVLIILVYRLIKKQEVAWKFGFGIGLALVLVGALLALNNSPTFASRYPATTDWWVYVAKQSLQILGGLIMMGIQTVLFAAVGKPLLEEYFPKNRRGDINGSAERPASLLRTLFDWCAVGYALGIILLAVHTLYYVIARKYGAWYPASARFSNSLFSYVPTYSIVGSSLIAALAEEVPFRLYAMPLIKKYTRSTLLAVLIPAFIWAATHGGYAVSPFYLRIIELTIIGIIYAFFFIKFGFLVCLIAHYIVDAVGGTIISMESGSAIATITMVAVLLLPIATILSYTGIRTFSSQTPHTNRPLDR